MGEKLGQHFLKSKAVVRDMIAAADVGVDDTVLEIGPGKGILTEALVARAGTVVAIEKDQILAEKIKRDFHDAIARGTLDLVIGDALDFDPDYLAEMSDCSYKLVANIPYYITGKLLRTYLTAACQPRSMTLLVQKEVAERILAPDGKESKLSISVKAYGTPTVVRTVSAGSFSPPPKVDSAILHINDISRAFFENVDEKRFFSLVSAGFSHKRKQLKNNLAAQFPSADIPAALNACDLTPTVRAERLSAADWRCISQSI